MFDRTRVKRSTEFRLVFRMSKNQTKFFQSMRKLTFITIFAFARFRKGSTQFGFVARDRNVRSRIRRFHGERKSCFVVLSIGKSNLKKNFVKIKINAKQTCCKMRSVCVEKEREWRYYDALMASPSS